MCSFLPFPPESALVGCALGQKTKFSANDWLKLVPPQIFPISWVSVGIPTTEHHPRRIKVISFVYFQSLPIISSCNWSKMQVRASNIQHHWTRMLSPTLTINKHDYAALALFMHNNRQNNGQVGDMRQQSELTGLCSSFGLGTKLTNRKAYAITWH